jgi:hypothetical protein
MGWAETDTGMYEPANFFERRPLPYQAGNETSQFAVLLRAP